MFKTSTGHFYLFHCVLQVLISCSMHPNFVMRAKMIKIIDALIALLIILDFNPFVVIRERSERPEDWVPENDSLFNHGDNDRDGCCEILQVSEEDSSIIDMSSIDSYEDTGIKFSGVLSAFTYICGIFFSAVNTQAFLKKL